jgi:hypothetical protein
MFELWHIFLFFLFLLFLDNDLNFVAICVSFFQILIHLLLKFGVLPVDLLILDTHLQVSVNVRLLYLRLASIYEQSQLVIELMDQLQHILVFRGHRLC